MTPPLPNTIGRYALLDRLGHGGMGVVYRAWDPELRRKVALKIIAGSREAPVEDSVFERFAREAQSAASLTHPNIVTIHDFGQDAGRPYIVMELVDGESMAQMIQRRASLSLSRRVRLAAELCEGLAYAHERGVIHRDVKPANLMVTSAGVLKILDFGLARLTDDLTSGGLTQTGAVMGTPQYMSPEQVSGLAADARSDIFAVGTVLYELFTGQMAFEGHNSALVRLMVLHDSPRPMSDIVPGFPPRLAALVTRAMEKERTRRYQTLDQLAAELRNWERESGGRELVERGGAKPEEEPGGERAFDSPALGGMLDQWEQLVGEALAEPAAAEAPAPANGRGGASADSGRSAAAPVRDSNREAAIAPSRTMSQRKRVRTVVIVVIAVASALAAFGVYVATRRPAGEPPSIAAPREPLAAPAPAADPLVPPTADPSEQRPTAGEPRSSGPPPMPRTNRTDGAPPPQIAARCAEILQRAGIGEELTASDRAFLSSQCRNRSQ
jgi:hypothetical protein